MDQTMTRRHRHREKRKVSGTRLNSLEPFACYFLHYTELNMRNLLCEAGEVCRQKVWRDSRNGSNHELPLLRSRHLLDFHFGRADLAQNGLGPGQEGLTHLSEAHAASQAVKKSRAELILKLADLLRE